MNVLAVSAHPDDLEILCGGTLRLMVERGNDVTMTNIARGDAGSFHHAPDRTAGIRAREGAAVIGAQYVEGVVSDGRVNSADEAQREMVVDLIRRVRPDVIITHAANDYMPDHVGVSKLVFDAAFIATLPNYLTTHPAHSQVAVIYSMDTMAGVEFLPTEFVDITDTLQTKLNAFRAHESQISWLKEHDHIDMLEQIEITARLRGFQSGVHAAEGFTISRTRLRTPAARPAAVTTFASVDSSGRSHADVMPDADTAL